MLPAMSIALASLSRPGEVATSSCSRPCRQVGSLCPRVLGREWSRAITLVEILATVLCRQKLRLYFAGAVFAV